MEDADLLDEPASKCLSCGSLEVSNYEPQPASLLLLLRPALHWKERSGDELSEHVNHVAA